jgi:UDP-N-acetylglucosamine pyrophosphorylase
LFKKSVEHKTQFHALKKIKLENKVRKYRRRVERAVEIEEEYFLFNTYYSVKVAGTLSRFEEYISRTYVYSLTVTVTV